MKFPKTLTAALLLATAFLLSACSQASEDDRGHAHGEDTHTHEVTEAPSTGSQDTHVHADGSTHDDHKAGMQDVHEEIQLEPVSIGSMRINLTQNHGPVNAGKEEHLILKFLEGGDEINAVRAWIGTEDRTLSYVGKGEYNIINDAYDIHATAPDPLPESVMWWIEIEKLDGTKMVGSAKPIM